jgi:hypothetical protein
VDANTKIKKINTNQLKKGKTQGQSGERAYKSLFFFLSRCTVSTGVHNLKIGKGVVATFATRKRRSLNNAIKNRKIFTA